MPPARAASGTFYGAGVAYAFPPDISARFELQKPPRDNTNLSAGLLFKF